MDLAPLLRLNRGEIIGLAAESLRRAPLEHYIEEGHDENYDTMTELFDLTIQCIDTRNYLPLIDFAERLARERFEQYYDLHDVHIAFNVLEEEIWKKITDELDPKYYQEALSLVSTVVGFGKEMLAETFGQLSSEKVYIKPYEYGLVSVAY